MYLTEGQACRLDERAAADGATRSKVIREAVDAYLGRPAADDAERLDRFRAAVRKAAGSAPYLTHDHVDEMRAAGARKLTEFEQRGRS